MKMKNQILKSCNSKSTKYHGTKNLLRWILHWRQQIFRKLDACPRYLVMTCDVSGFGLMVVCKDWILVQMIQIASANYNFKMGAT